MKSASTEVFRKIEMLPHSILRNFNSFSVLLANPTLSFINRPLQIGYLLNGVHEFVLGPYTQNGDLGLAQILAEIEFYVVDLEKVNRRNR